MNAQQWQATAEIIATTITAMTFLGVIFLRLLQTRFVMRDEHEGLCKRVDGVEVDMTRTVKKEDLSKLNDRLFNTEEKLADVKATLSETNGLLKGTMDSTKALSGQLNILIEAGLAKDRS